MVAARPTGLGGLGGASFPIDGDGSNNGDGELDNIAVSLPDVDTPSKWLTFGGGTPNGTGGGSTTPGTAFGSPFWASLAAGAGAGSNRGSPRSLLTAGGSWNTKYSPSKELNPFEMSWGNNGSAASTNTAALHDLPSFISATTGGGGTNNNSGNTNNTGGHSKAAEDVAASGVDAPAPSGSSLRSSLKRPFEDAALEAASTRSSTTSGPSRHSSGDSYKLTGGKSDNNGDAAASSEPTTNIPNGDLLAIPVWKRPKFANDSNPQSFAPSIPSSDSPAASATSTTGGAGNQTSPSGDDSVDSPASTLLPTPSVNPPILAGQHAHIQHHPSSNLRKSSLNLEQIEAAKLASGDSAANQPNMTNIMFDQQLQQQQLQHQQSHLHQQHSAYAYPAYMGHSAPSGSQSFASQHFPPQGYSGMHHPITQGPPAPLVLPPKSHSQIQAQQHQQVQLLHQQQQQRMLAQQQAATQQQYQFQQQQQQQQQHQQQLQYQQHQYQQQSERALSPTSPVLNQGEDANNQSMSNPNAIPYANGRAPSAQPVQTRRASRKRAAAAAAAIAIKAEDLDEIPERPSQATNKLLSTSASAAPTSMSAGGKNLRRQAPSIDTTVAQSASAMTGASPVTAIGSARKASAADMAPASAGTAEKKAKFAPAPVSAPPIEIDHLDFMNGVDENGDPIDEEEAKRRAFLERNRQAACRSRQKKKEWIGNLEHHASQLQAQNSALTSEIEELRKELFALRHTLSFHERCGCSAHGADAKGMQLHPHAHMMQHTGVQQHQQQHIPQQHTVPQPMSGTGPAPGSQPALASNAGNVTPMAVQPQPMPLRQQQQQQAQGHQAVPNSLALPLHMQHLQPPPAHLGLGARPGGLPSHFTAHQSSGMSGTLAGPPMSGPALSDGPTSTLAPSPRRVAPQNSQLTSHAPGQLNFAPPSMQSFFAHHSGSAGHSAGDVITRPGSAGATFGLATPNFADLFGGAMHNLRTPGALMRMSPSLPNTFGLSLQDIPVRPLSAPPTPSPNIPGAASFISHPGQSDYFSSKRTTGGHHGASSYLDSLFLGSDSQAGGIMA